MGSKLVNLYVTEGHFVRSMPSENIVTYGIGDHLPCLMITLNCRNVFFFNSIKEMILMKQCTSFRFFSTSHSCFNIGTSISFNYHFSFVVTWKKQVYDENTANENQFSVSNWAAVNITPEMLKLLLYSILGRAYFCSGDQDNSFEHLTEAIGRLVVSLCQHLTNFK